MSIVLLLIAAPLAALVIVRRFGGDITGDVLVGAGATAGVAGVGMLARRNTNYHLDGFPYVDEVETFGIGDTSARVNALLAGDIHFTVRVDPKSIQIVERSPGVVMANAPCAAP